MLAFCKCHSAQLARQARPSSSMTVFHTVIPSGFINLIFEGFQPYFTAALQEFYESKEADEVDGIEDIVEAWTEGLWASVSNATLPQARSTSACQTGACRLCIIQNVLIALHHQACEAMNMHVRSGLSARQVNSAGSQSAGSAHCHKCCHPHGVHPTILAIIVGGRATAHTPGAAQRRRRRQGAARGFHKEGQLCGPRDDTYRRACTACLARGGEAGRGAGGAGGRRRLFAAKRGAACVQGP